MREQLQQNPSVRNRVARRAYELFILRGRQIGREAEDWFKAEAEILAELMQETAQHKEEATKSEVSQEVASIEVTTVAPKKRTYTRKKKDAEIVAEQVEVKPEVVAKEAAKPAAKRGRSKTTVATDLA
ncbi:MAG: DUF2934 domain-containing protein [Blastocatellia bacterium]|nr:DUF2934 domain-containing protein [Blastocatellia bacterium]